jgi:hypothetical protein
MALEKTRGEIRIVIRNVLTEKGSSCIVFLRLVVMNLDLCFGWRMKRRSKERHAKKFNEGKKKCEIGTR